MIQPDKDKKDKEKKEKKEKEKEKKEKEKRDKEIKKSKKKNGDIQISMPSNFRSLDGDTSNQFIQPQYHTDDDDNDDNSYSDDISNNNEYQQQYYDQQNQQNQQYYTQQQSDQQYQEQQQYQQQPDQYYYQEQEQPQIQYDGQQDSSQQYYSQEQTLQQQQEFNQVEPIIDQYNDSSNLVLDQPPPLPEKKNCKLLDKVQKQQKELIEKHQEKIKLQHQHQKQHQKVYFKVSNELLDEVKKWEDKKKDYSIAVNSLLVKKQQQLDVIFNDYLLELKPILEKHFPSDLKNEIESNEKERLLSVKQNLFGSQNASISTIENRIKQKRTEIDMHNKITLIQSIVRMWLAKKKFKVLKSQNSRRNLCLQEIVETERKYVESLSLMINVFLVPLQTSKKDLLSTNEITNIFGNCSVIYGVHNELLESLETNLKNYQKQQYDNYLNIGKNKSSQQQSSSTTQIKSVAECFLSLSPFLKLYTQYINNFNNATSTLLECKKRDSKVNQFFFKDCKDNKALDKRDFLDLQIQPVQRIPRYKLLLTELLQCTPKDHYDYENVKNALCVVQELAMNINESKRNAEGLEKIILIQGSLTRNIELVKPYRKHIKDSSIYFEKRGKIKERHLFLFNDSLLLCKKVSTILGVPINNSSISNSISSSSSNNNSNNSSNNHVSISSSINNSTYNSSSDIRYIPLSFIDMNNVNIFPTQDYEYQYGFAVLGNEHLYFYTKNAIEQHEWLLILKEITKELQQNQLSLRKDQSDLDLRDSLLNPLVKQQQQQSNRDSIQGLTLIVNPNRRQSTRLNNNNNNNNNNYNSGNNGGNSYGKEKENQAKVVERYSVNLNQDSINNKSSSTLHYSPPSARSSIYMSQQSISPPLSSSISLNQSMSSNNNNNNNIIITQQLQQTQQQLQQLQSQQNNYQTQIQQLQQVIEQQQLKIKQQQNQQQLASIQPVSSPIIQQQQPKIKELLVIYNEINQLQKELINPSNQFDILFGGQINQINLIRQQYPNTEAIYNRLSTILNKLTELKNQSSLATNKNPLFKNEEVLTNLQNVISQGKDHIGAYNEWIKRAYPLGPNDPSSHQPRSININLMKWYNSLHVAWLSILELNK